jgi:large repetitive protein
MGGELIEGRVYTNEYITLMNGNGISTSAVFYVLTKDGFIYQVNANEVDPFRFPFFSNSLGLVDWNSNPAYRSAFDSEVIIDLTGDISNWAPGSVYLYRPQSKDAGLLVNNKLFFNIPNPDLPGTAAVTDVFNDETYTTWLRRAVEEFRLDSIYLLGLSTQDYLCAPGTMEYAGGAYIILEANLGGIVTLELDLNNNGIFNDPEDVKLGGKTGEGIDSIFWDGNDGLGNPVFIQDDFTFGYRGSIRFGECHFILADVENCEGGVTFEWLNPFDGTQPNLFYYNHSDVGGPISGSQNFGDPLPTSIPFTYAFNFGNEKYLDHWTLIETQLAPGTITVDMEATCPEISTYFQTDPYSISLMPFSDGYEEPLDLAHCGDERLFVVEKKRKNLDR